MIYSIIFDKDGVIIDSEHIHFNGFSNVIKSEYGISIEEDFGYVGRPPARAFRYLLSKNNVFPDEKTLPDLRNKWMEEVTNILKESEIKANEGIYSLLDLCRDMKLKIGLVTNSSREQASFVLSKLGIIDRFNSTVCNEDIPVDKRKPDPAPYIAAMEGLKNCKGEECVVVEDSPSGVESAKGAGMNCIGLETGYFDLNELKQKGADITVKKLDEIDCKTLSGF